MSQFKEDILHYKSRRTETARKIKALHSKTERILNKEIVADTSLTDMLLEVDNLFVIFSEEHQEFITYIGYLKEVNPAEAKRAEIVNSKDPEAYYNETEQYARQTKKKLKTAIKAEEEDTNALNEIKKDEKRKKADRNTKRIMRAVANNFAQLGVNQAELDQLENWDLVKLQKLKARIEIIQKSLQELDTSIETLEKIGGSASIEVIDNYF